MHMYRNGNISARTKSRESKEACFYRNIPVLNILFYIGKGFMLRKQMIVLVKIFYNLNQHRTNEMITDLLAHGLVIKNRLQIPKPVSMF